MDGAPGRHMAPRRGPACSPRRCTSPQGHNGYGVATRHRTGTWSSSDAPSGIQVGAQPFLPLAFFAAGLGGAMPGM